MKNNFMPNKISRDKVIKRGYHTENFAKNLRNCSSETKKAFKKTLNNKIMHKKSMNTDTLDQNCSRMEEISIENQSKVAPTKSKFSSNDQAKIKHKNRKKRILTECSNFDSKKDHQTTSCTPVSQIDFYATSDPAMKHYTSLTNETKIKQRNFGYFQEMHHSLTSLRQKNSHMRTSLNKNLMFCTKKSDSKDLKGKCKSPRKSFSPKSNFYYSSKPKQSSQVNSKSKQDAFKHCRLKTRRKTNTANDQFHIINEETFIVESKVGLKTALSKKLSSSNPPNKSQHKFPSKSGTPKAHNCSSRLSFQNESKKENQNMNSKRVSKERRKLSPSLKATKKKEVWGIPKRIKDRKSSTKAKKMHRMGLFMGNETIRGLNLVFPGNGTLLKPRKSHKKNINTSRVMLGPRQNS
ncbi:unnamed protein product [Moneuplotes crassus]|uniref:Uncharacterized protein n=1 Tax=Euplotes crassus TaxID=5936 RepID=A0AAD1XVM0_EUPCR|nr:unnamed protein product [Moneuplotes crassus]